MTPAYDGNGNILSITDALNNRTAFTYDAMNRISTIIDAKGGITTYVYTPTGLVQTMTNAEGAVITRTYDANGNVLTETNGESETTSYKYDALNRVTEVKDPLGNTETFTYDAKGRILTAKDKNGNITSYVYDGNGNVVETVDALNGTSSFKYNAAGDIVKMTLNRVDTKNNINEQQVTIYEYNGNGLLKKTINAAGKTALYVYDGNNNLIQKTDEQGLVTKYSYNSLDLVSNINYNNGKSANYTYNKVGELVKMDDWTGVNTFEVDLLKRITKTTDAKGKQVEYTYDQVGNQSSIKYPDNTVTSYTYDLIGQMKTVTEPGNKVTSYHYDLAGRMTERLYPNDWEEFYNYDAAGRLLEVKDTDPSNKKMKSINLSYTYDANGNKLSEYKRGNAAGSAKEDVHYLYDALDRVTSAHENYGNTTRLYEYDSLGNVVWERFANGTPNYYDYKYNNLNQMTEKKIGGKDKNTYEYDLRGNLLQENYVKNNNKSSIVATYIYDEMNKMMQGTNEAGEISLYTYNGLGGLVGGEMIVDKNAYGYHGFDNIEPSVPTTLKKHEVIKKDFVLDYTSELMNTLQETEYQGLSYRYGYGTDRISAFITPIPNGGGNLVENEAIKVYYHKDYLGTTDFMTSDYTGKVVSWTMYNEWGQITHNAVLNCNVRELDLVKNYTGYEYDSVIGLYFAKNRMYDPDMHRFTQIDPIKDGLNWYAYVGNNPVNYVDPLGLKPPATQMIKAQYRALMHNAVVNDIGIKNPTWFTNVFFTKENGSKGFVDIISDQGYIWDVKSANEMAKNYKLTAAKAQVASYVHGSWNENSKMELGYGYTIPSGETTVILGGYYYFVVYACRVDAPYIIQYSYENIGPTEFQEEIQKVIILLTETFLLRRTSKGIEWTPYPVPAI